MSVRPAFRRMAALCVAGVSLVALSLPSAANAVGSNLLVNPGFEDPNHAPNPFGEFVADADFPGWGTTDSEGKFEVWSHLDGTTYTAGQLQYIELNAYSAGAVYQDIVTTPCDTLTWTLDHRARMIGTDTMSVLAGVGGGTGSDGLVATEANSRDGVTIAATTDIADDNSLSDSDAAWDNADNWHTWIGTYQVPAGQTLTRIAFKASDNVADPSIGNFIDNVVLTAAAGECPTDAAALPNTGTDVAPLGVAGLIALAASAAGVVLVRRRNA